MIFKLTKKSKKFISIKLYDEFVLVPYMWHFSDSKRECRVHFLCFQFVYYKY